MEHILHKGNATVTALLFRRKSNLERLKYDDPYSKKRR